MKRVTRFFLAGFSALLTISLVIIACLVLIAYSTNANRYLIEQATQWVPGLEIELKSGSLMQSMAFDLQYEDNYVVVRLERARMRLRTTCLWQMHLCIENLRVQRLSIDLKPQPATDDPADTDSKLASIPLPFLLRLEQSQFVEFEMSQSQQPFLSERNLKLRARWFGHNLNVIQLSGNDDYCQWVLHGEIRFKDYYPITASANCTTELAELAELNYISAEVSGDLKRLKIQAASRGTLALQVKGTLDPLGENLPFELSTKTRHSYNLAEVGIDGKVTQAQLVAKGSLAGIDLKATVAATTDQVPNPLLAQLDGHLTLKQLKINALHLEHGADVTVSQGLLQFGNPLQWQGSTRVKALDLTHFDANLPQQITGNIKHQITFEKDKLWAQADLKNIKGVLQDYPFELNGGLEWNGQTLSIAHLQLHQQSNRILVNGYWSLKESDLRLDFALPDLMRLHSELQGSLYGPVHLSGNLEQPGLEAELIATDLHYQEFSLAKATTQWRWQTNDRANNHIELTVDQFRVNDTAPYQFALNWDGQLADHEIAVTGADSTNNTLSLNCSGQFSQPELSQLLNGWQARCNNLAINLQHPDTPQQWRLEAPLSVALSKQFELELSPWCLAWQDASLCSAQSAKVTPQLLGPIRLNAQKLNLAWVQPWLPKHLQLTGFTDATLNAQGPWSQWQLESTIEGQAVQLTTRQSEDTPLAIQLEQANAQLSASPSETQLRWQLSTPQTGQSKGRLALNNQRQLTGEASISGLQVEPYAEVFLPDRRDRVTGVVNGQVNLLGTLDRPQVKGDFSFTDGAVFATVLPFPLDNIDFKLLLTNERAQVDGSFSIEEQAGKINGYFDWSQPQWASEIHLTAGVIPYQHNDDILVHIEPDIIFNISPKAVTLGGSINIPKTRIYLKALPEQAITSSPDEVIVGRAESEVPFEVTTDLKVILGDDVRFNGFGLDTRLAGSMHIKQSRNALIKAKGIIRLEDGTYQAYGQYLTITNGDLIFIDEIENPQLRLSATRDRIKDDVEVGIRVTGRAQDPQISVYSIPAMPQQAKLHYLLTGRAPNTEVDSDSSRLAAETALAMALETQSTNARKVGSKLGIEDLTLTADSTEDGSQVGVAGYITPDLMIRYGVGMFDAVNSITLNYRIRKSLYFEVISGKSNAFDILYSFDRD